MPSIGTEFLASSFVFLCQVTLDEKKTVTADFSIVWSSSDDVTKYESYFSLPEFIEFPTVIPGQHAYAYFYAPHNPSFQGSSDEKPPLLVRIHGNQPDHFLSLVYVIVCLKFS